MQHHRLTCQSPQESNRSWFPNHSLQRAEWLCRQYGGHRTCWMSVLSERSVPTHIYRHKFILRRSHQPISYCVDHSGGNTNWTVHCGGCWFHDDLPSSTSYRPILSNYLVDFLPSNFMMDLGRHKVIHFQGQLEVLHLPMNDWISLLHDEARASRWRTFGSIAFFQTTSYNLSILCSTDQAWNWPWISFSSSFAISPSSQLKAKLSANQARYGAVHGIASIAQAERNWLGPAPGRW